MQVAPAISVTPPFGCNLILCKGILPVSNKILVFPVWVQVKNGNALRVINSVNSSKARFKFNWLSFHPRF
jgi:hypothetical protein